MTTSIFAFLPVGSPSTATEHTIRLGLCKNQDSVGENVIWSQRFHGLNKPRETLFFLSLSDKREADKYLDALKYLLRGPGKINTIEIKHFETFSQANDLGLLWWRTRLPLADIRAIFYDVLKGFEETIAEHMIADENRDRRAQRQAGPGQPGEV